MKKLVAIGFLSLFVLQYAWFYAYFGSRLITIHQEMRILLKAIPEKKLERIILNTQEFNKVDFDEKEIEFHGKMYDIAKIETHPDRYILFAVNDESEDHLLSLLDEIVKRSGNDKKPVPSQLLQFFSLVFISPLVNFEFSQDLPKLISLDYPNLYCSIQSSIDSPPPQG